MMDKILYEMDCGLDMPTFQLGGLDSSLLDDEELFTLRKVQGDVYSPLEDQQDVVHQLFPDLLPLGEESDPLSMDWMETVDLSHFTEKPEVPVLEHVETKLKTSLPIVVHPQDVDLLNSLLEESTNEPTPPVSPPAQVAPVIEIDINHLDFDHEAAWEIINSYPLSPQEVERVLTPESLSPSSSCPSSPADSQFSTIDSSPLESEVVKRRPKPQRTKTKKYSKASIDSDDEFDFSFRKNEKLSKKERKKLQNKNAATKYRMKKKLESALILTEEQQLENKNEALKLKVEQLSREISCMKEVLGEIYKGMEAKTK